VKEEKNTKEETEERAEAVIYEIGYHLIPSIAEEDVPAEASTLKDTIESVGGMILSDENPKSRQLAYSIDHVVANVKNVYDTAYFGWIKFFVTPDAVARLKEAIEINHNVFRFLIVKTVREDTLAKRPVRIRQKPTGEKEKTDASTETKGPVLSTEELDKTIENLVIE